MASPPEGVLDAVRGAPSEVGLLMGKAAGCVTQLGIVNRQSACLATLPKNLKVSKKERKDWNLQLLLVHIL